jgi:hypothetical protein
MNELEEQTLSCGLSTDERLRPSGELENTSDGQRMKGGESESRQPAKAGDRSTPNRSPIPGRFRQLKGPRTRLSPRQETCLLLLLSGRTQADAARALHIHPTTVWRWMRPGTIFEITLRERLSQVWASERKTTSDILHNLLHEMQQRLLNAQPVEILENVVLFSQIERALPPNFEPCPRDRGKECPHASGTYRTPMEEYQMILKAGSGLSGDS